MKKPSSRGGSGTSFPAIRYSWGDILQRVLGDGAGINQWR